MNFLHVAVLRVLPGEQFITEVTLDLSISVFLLDVPLEDGLGGEVLSAHRADFLFAQVLRVDVNLQVMAGGELAPTELTDLFRMFVLHVSC